jgi:ABC-type enterochelin transport system ATPase subunit
MKIICNGNQEVYDHLTCWEATMCQYPMKKIVNLYLIGSGGSGKSTYMEFMANLAGNSGIALDYADVVDKFNTLLKDKIVVGINEVDRILPCDLALLKNYSVAYPRLHREKALTKK